MENIYPNRNIICIDLKSFFASCECLIRNLDPFTTPLVVANKNQGNGAITLAVTPFLKIKGVKSRGRLYEIPNHIKYTIVNPQMKLYMQKSCEVVKVYLDFVAEEDLHIYSIDECFLDVTDYLKMYNKNDYELALTILKTVKEKTGLTATCGIGPNMLLAKVAMDIEAKHNDDFIAKWTYDDIPSKLWPITPLSKMWGIGPNMEKKLNKLKIKTIGDLAKYDRYSLKDKFGVMGLELWNHANGIDLSKIRDWKSIKKEASYNHSQVLFKDYYGEDIELIISEMVDIICARLRSNSKQAMIVGLGITYSKNIGGGFFHTTKLDNPTDNALEITSVCNFLFERYYTNLPIRKVTISLGNLCTKSSVQLDLFNSVKEIESQNELDEAIDKIRDKYGKNTILKATSLLENSTIKDRNNKIGGHQA